MADPLRICFVITRADSIGGAQIHVRDLSLALRRRGHEVHVLSGPGELLSHLFDEGGVRLHVLPHLGRRIGPLRDTRAFRELRSLLKRLNPDLVSTHSSKAGALGRLAAWSLGLPAVFTAHGWSFGPGRPWPARWLYEIVERLMSPFGSRTITVSDADLTLALDSAVATRRKLVTVHNAMPDVGPGLLAEPARSPPALIMVARFAAQKNHRLLVEALACLRDLNWSLTLVGEGPEESSVPNLVRELGLGDRVAFSGFRRDVAAILARHQIFVLASLFEGLPRSVIEAMRAGLPAVVTDVGGTRELVEDGVNGFLVPPAGTGPLKEALAALIADADLRNRMGLAARRRYEDMFTFDRLVEETLAVYRQVLEDRAPPHS